MAQGIDINELERIIDEQQDRLYQFAFFRLGDHSRAQDIVQDAFVKLYQQRHRVDNRNLQAYLMRMVYNACADLQRQRRRKRPDVPLEQAANLLAEEPNEAHREFLRIEQLLSILPEEQAEVVKMRFTDGLSFVDIAEILQLSDNTVKSRYRYALDKLRRHYKDLEFDE